MAADLKKYLSQLDVSISNMTVLQIGANDGKQSDPLNEIIKENDLKAHLLEPIPEYFALLKKQYADHPNVTCHNIAISTYDGEAVMTYVPVYKDLPEWTKGLGTLDVSGNFLGEGRAGYKGAQDWSKTDLYKLVKSREKTVTVKTKTLDTFLSENKIFNIDIFVTDAEGYDFLIFNQLDLNKYNPYLICMETHFLGEDANKKINEKLEKHGYIYKSAWDTVAIKNR